MLSQIGYFWRDDIANMNKIHVPIVYLDDIYIKKFIQKEVDGEYIQTEDLIRNWWHDPNSFKVIGDKIYHVPRLRNPSKMTDIILCCLYGEKDNSEFKLSWVNLIHQVLKEGVFNWAHILSANIKL
jgi:hypothetical protein